MKKINAIPVLWTGAIQVWLRNANVWRKSWKTSLIGSIGEPLLYFFGIGYGLGTIVPSIQGQPYLHFVAPGLMLSSVMYSSTIESTYSTFTKMEHQKVYASMVLSPLSFDEIVLGEILWAVTKGMVSGGTVLLLALVFGVGKLWPGGVALFLILLAGVLFSSLGLIVTSTAGSYDFFNYYFTLFISPMFFFSGIFFPLSSLGKWAELVGWIFPLTHLVNISRALFAGNLDAGILAEVAWVSVFAMAAFFLAIHRMSRRFMP